MPDRFATALPGIGVVLAEELAELGLQPARDIGFDGRNDVVGFRGRANWRGLRVAEDVYVEVGATTAAVKSVDDVVQVITPVSLEGALSVWAADVRPLARRMGVRVVARVREERRFRRTSLRAAVGVRLEDLRPHWVAADPADLEVWVLEVGDGGFRVGLRLSDATMRHRAGRVVERPGALRPTVAGAMVRLANGNGADARAGAPPMLDPCCGGGTILAEAAAVGWTAIGGDIDRDAVVAARTNVVDAAVAALDARTLPWPDGAFGAVVTNLPFGDRFRVPGDPTNWLAGVLHAARRVLAGSSAALVVLVPDSRPFASARDRAGLDAARRIDLSLLGRRTAMWVLREAPR